MSAPSTTAATPLRWGILGCARITRRGLAPAIRSSQTGQLQALASRNGQLAQEWAAEYGIPKAYDNYEALLADPEVDAVYLPLPNELHQPWVLAAADAGKHVLCEKPLARNADEAAEMVEHCRNRGVLLMEGFMWRHQPRTSALLRKVQDGDLGQLHLVRSSFSFPIAEGDWRLDPDRGGGALWDIGCYGVNCIRLFLGAEPTAIRAIQRLGSSSVDMTLSAQLAFPGGLLGLIDCSFQAPFRCEYELVGTTGAIRVPDAYLPPAEPLAIQIGAGGDYGGDQPQTLRFEGTDQYRCLVDAFAQSVAQGRLIAPAEDGFAQMRVLDAIKAEALTV